MEEKNNPNNLSEESDALRSFRKECADMTKNLPPAKQKRRRGTFTEKLNSLWQDRRSLRIRLILSALCAFAFSFTFLVFGPYELYISNMAYLTFSFSSLIMPMSLAGIAVFAALFIILLLLRGKIFNYALSALFAVTLCGYLQGNFFNLDHGSLDGSAIDWTALTLPTLLNLLLWIGIFIMIFTVLYFSRRIWAMGIQILCVILIGAQIVALAVLIQTSDFPVAPDDSYVSNKGIYDISTQKNVVVFLLDRFDNIYADHLLEQYPEWQQHLNGFTYYHNFTGSYSRTMPSVAYLLTGIKCDYTIPFEEYFKKAWTESTFLSDIRAAGYQTRVYSELSYVFGDAANLRGKVDNLGTAARTVDYNKMLKYMLSLSAYRYAPEALKPSFWLYTGELASISTVEDNSDSIHVTDDVAFWQAFRKNGLNIDRESKGAFIFYHMQGSHDPYTMNENAERISQNNTTEGLYAQTAGNIKMIFEYIDQLKQAGIYDNTTIIITADHGRTGTIAQLDSSRLLSLFIKPAGADLQTPMIISQKQVCQDNLRASMISYFGLDHTAYGRTLESIGEDEPMVRYFWMQGSDEARQHRDTNLQTYKITGDANDFGNWELVSTDPIQYPYYDTTKTIGR